MKSVIKELSWEDFKRFVSDRNLSIHWFDTEDTYHCATGDKWFTVSCSFLKTSDEAAEFEANFKPIGNKKFINEVETQFERQDIILKLASASASFDQDGIAEISLKVPGEPNSGLQRYVAGGFAFTDVFGFGDRVTKVNVVDVDNILGMGDHTILKCYHDEDMPELNQGWFLWPSAQVGGEVEIDPIGYYGAIPAGLYLEIYFKKSEASSATKVFCDVWWGRNE